MVIECLLLLPKVKGQLNRNCHLASYLDTANDQVCNASRSDTLRQTETGSIPQMATEQQTDLQHGHDTATKAKRAVVNYSL